MAYVSQTTSLDLWTFVVALMSTVLGLLALIVTVLYGRQQIRLAREQLTLARKEAENQPVLEVSAMDLIDPARVDAVVDTVRERREWLNKWERYEREKQEYERRQADAPTVGIANLVSGPLPRPPQRLLALNNPRLLAQQDYEGPIPNKVLRVTLTNKGATAALDISGQLNFNPKDLQPLDFPGLNGRVQVSEDGTYQTNLYTPEGSRLLPAPTDEERTFYIAVVVKNTGTTHVRYAFATPQGDNVESVYTLDLPPP